ncbi:hypothetical protein CYY_009992 [Polysphondylium violaceum]|uniref:TLDc domain-containing protein n=1 Tax=Polysphondylium violaceum TaxID=133409 RepID=A0A8J4UVI1_9MYCE|nr:hypothetical protein CYY_009992 [Polysphondylium violaceum]
MDNTNNTPPQTLDKPKRRKHILESIDGLKDLLEDHFESLEQEIKDLEKKRDALLNVAKVIDVSVIPDPITLNIGGIKYQTTKATLTKIPNSFFDLMLSGEIDIKPMTNKPNTYFIDRDGSYFNYILNYLRDEGDIQIPEIIRHCVRKEMEFYRINDHFKLDDTTTIIDQLHSLNRNLDETKQELILTIQELALTKEECNNTRKESENLKQEFHSFKNKEFGLHIKSEPSRILNPSTFKIISDWIDTTKLTNFELLYSASETNKFSGSAFHSACDGKGATITVIETTDGCVFGGYNSLSWKNDWNIPQYHLYFYGDDKCFIFTLVNKHEIPPTKYFANENNTNYVGSGPLGFAFGTFTRLSECDIRIGKKNSYQMFPTSYADTTGKGYTTLTPYSKFKIKYLEIYKCS